MNTTSMTTTIAPWKQKLPMWITVSRIFVVPLVLLCMVPNTFGWNVGAAILFILASITDYYDGYFARKYNAVSNMGKFMDPVADKILVSSILVMMAYYQKIDPWMVVVLLSRDNFISGIRAVAAADGVVIAAKSAGKWKTALQMGAIPGTMIGEIPGYLPYLDKIAYGILWISVLLSISSGVEYYLAYMKSRKAKA
ncbi:CDP-diacylglycerol--glycerol-3-phosphate 3-phosphatidyltransferase [Bdellovibrio sp. HCB337]|uniref:CDP-diacylglycerol--glycerol-3-phosphate 3-phosphatidyltransferase n=1 Tax=Bdellovibrio sp. HCB337 TaxID=3394358 RepID=UPI0039A4F87C